VQDRGYDRLYVEFVYYFNIMRDYFECHEVMEELWLEEGRSPLLQGLLQVAVGLYHHANGNVSGAVKLLTAALEKLATYPPQVLGIDLDKLRQDSADYLAKLHRIEEAPFDPYDLDLVILDPRLDALVRELDAQPPVKEEH
jgi:predicted metal-dependent hydrolase